MSHLLGPKTIRLANQNSCRALERPLGTEVRVHGIAIDFNSCDGAVHASIETGKIGERHETHALTEHVPQIGEIHHAVIGVSYFRAELNGPIEDL
ncbi:MAG: hypothetical protein QF437_04225, partial [Planctomycetota bacterium]|nr:hypothetical protein [Planctomycetota bacterium]